VADVAICKYHKDTSTPEVIKKGVAAAMRFSIKVSTEKCYKKLFKIVAIANLALGLDWLVEVYSTHHIL